MQLLIDKFIDELVSYKFCKIYFLNYLQLLP